MGAGRHFLIMVVVGARGGAGCTRCHACGCLWMVVTLPCEGGGAGALVIMRVGACQRWWGAGRRLSIMVVVGAHGWHWVVVAVNGAGGCLSSFVGGGAYTWRHGRCLWVFMVAW